MLLGVSKYNDLRGRLDQLEDNDGLKQQLGGGAFDLDAVSKDIKHMQEGLWELGFEEKNITTLLEADADTITKTLKEIKTEIVAACKKGEKVVFFCYYAGHGAIDSETYCITGDGKPVELEKILRSFSCFGENSYYLALFDCCRSRLGLDKIKEVV